MICEQGSIGGLSLMIGGSEGQVQGVIRNDAVGGAIRRMAVTRPSVLARRGHHLGTDRVQFDVARTGQEVVVAVDQGGPVAAFPERAGAVVGGVEILHVPPTHGLQDLGETLRLLRRHEQMEMVGHQHVSVDGGPMLQRQSAEALKKTGVVLLSHENRRPVIAPLDDVQGGARNKEAGQSGHLGKLDTVGAPMDKSSLTLFLQSWQISRINLASSILAAVLVIGLLGTSEARAAGFEIVMSQDQALCQEVLSALNSDLAAYGELRLAEHPAIPAIHWRSMKELGSRLEDTDGVNLLWARFDSNNDGVVDLVVKESIRLREGAMVQGGSGVLSDDLYIFSATSDALTRVRTWEDFGKAYNNSGIGRFFWRYYELEYPLSKFPDDLGDELIVNAFRYREATYYHIDPIRTMISSASRLHVVTTYKGALDQLGILSELHPDGHKRLHDVCYLKKPITIEEHHPLDRSDDGLVIRP